MEAGIRNLDLGGTNGAERLTKRIIPIDTRASSLVRDLQRAERRF